MSSYVAKYTFTQSSHGTTHKTPYNTGKVLYFYRGKMNEKLSHFISQWEFYTFLHIYIYRHQMIGVHHAFLQTSLRKEKFRRQKNRKVKAGVESLSTRTIEPVVCKKEARGYFRVRFKLRKNTPLILVKISRWWKRMKVPKVGSNGS